MSHYAEIRGKALRTWEKQMREKLQTTIVDILTSSGGSLEPSDVFEKIRIRYGNHIDDLLIREAVWQLIAENKITLTTNRKFALLDR